MARRATLVLRLGRRPVIALDAGGSHEVVVTVRSFPMCIDFLPDGRLLVVDSAQRRLLRREPDGSLVQHADLSGISEKPWNDIVVDDRGNAYVNTSASTFPAVSSRRAWSCSSPRTAGRPGSRRSRVPQRYGDQPLTVDADRGRVVREPANRLRHRQDGGLGNRRVWAETPGDHPDGICMDAEGAVWYADVGNQHCVRVREGGEVLATVDLDRGAFACALSRGGNPRLFVVGQTYGGPESPQPSGRVVAFPAPAPGAGRP